MTRNDSVEMLCRSIQHARSVPDTCVRFNVAGDERKFIQVFEGMVNAVYPLDDEPKLDLTLGTLQSGSLRLLEWRRQGSAMFEYSDLSPEDLAAWLDQYLVEILGCSQGGYQVDVTYEEFSIDEEVAPVAETIYHPGRCHFTEGNAIVMPAGGWGESGIWDGYTTIEPGEPNYELWRWIVEDERWKHEGSSINSTEMAPIVEEFRALNANS